MRIYDIIKNKRDGKELSREEIEFFIKGYLDGSVADYQASALLMACFLNGMSDRETVDLTVAMAESGDKADLSSIKGIKVDKHSTGGVGDKTSLVVCPVVASLGLKVAKMSGRGLGHSGGTVDKLESIPGLRTSVPSDEFVDIVRRTGIAIVGQSGNFAPADKKLYALRDVTATVESVPLITSSIMSKKLAAGADCIVLDVKTGSGSFMKTLEDSRKLARSMVDIGKSAGKKVMAVITNMDRPLGNAVGNSIEVIEAVETLKGNGPADFTELCTQIASCMLKLAGFGNDSERLVKETIANGKAFAKFCEMVEAQGGDVSYLHDTGKFPVAPYDVEVLSEKSGYVHHVNAEAIGEISIILGAGREKKEDAIDYSAGITLVKKPGDFVEKGEPLAVLHTSRKERIDEAVREYVKATSILNEKPEVQPIVYDVVG